MTNLTVFDTPDALRINKARIKFLDLLIPEIMGIKDLSTVLDIGCGLGFFSKYLKDKGFVVTAADGRASNIAEAKRRFAGIEYKIYNVEDPLVTSMGEFDLVLCLGLLYHLENPFKAIRNLAMLTKNVLFIETVIAPYRAMAAFMYEENHDQNQGVNYTALIPTESWLIKSLYSAGFSFVYKTRDLPPHEDFRSSFVKKQRRTVLIASKVKLSLTSLKIAPASKTETHMWDSFKIGSLFYSEKIRKILKSILYKANKFF